MPRTDVERFQPGDVVAKGDERGYVRRLPSKFQLGTSYLIVQITSGPRKGQTEYPWKGWTPDLDHSVDGMRRQCRDCEREFRGEQPGEPKAIWCNTCQREHDGEDHRRAADPSYTSSSYERKQTREGMRG